MHPKAMKCVSALTLRKGAWSSDEDALLRKCIHNFGEGKWHLVPRRAELNRCRKSCRLRWLNYLRPTIRRGDFSADEVDLMMRLHRLLGNRWSLIAGRLPGRTGNEVKNFWNTNMKKKFRTACKEEELTHVVVKPLPRTLAKHTRISYHNDIMNFPSPGEVVCNDKSNCNDINMLIDKPPISATPKPDHDDIGWWKNLFEEIGIHSQGEDSSAGTMLMASSSSFHNLDAETVLIWEHQDLPMPDIEATGLLEEDARSSWCDFWDSLNSDFVN